MRRYLRAKLHVWRSYNFVHTVSSRVAGLSLITFCCVCFWLIFRNAEPTAVALALLAFISACGMYLNAGQQGLDAWTRRSDGSSSYQSNSTSSYTASATTTSDGDPPVNPASQDADDK